MYEKTVIGDQFAAGDKLVGVVRTDQLADMTLPTDPGPPTNSPQAMIRVGAIDQHRRNLSDPALRKFLATPLIQMCWEAREQASQVKTGLWPVSRQRAAVTVASGYLNACLNRRGPNAIEYAGLGIQRLDTLLGPDAGLLDWWNKSRDQIEDAASSNLSA